MKKRRGNGGSPSEKKAINMTRVSEFIYANSSRYEAVTKLVKRPTETVYATLWENMAGSTNKEVGSKQVPKLRESRRSEGAVPELEERTYKSVHTPCLRQNG